ncbi:MAG: response regulator [Epulopiscium sp.]|nr:response regulator [Candidatus Epulonipiscium sp.]
MTVLIVDDAAFVRTVLRNMLQQMGHTVVGEAFNGQDAINKAKELKPDVITMDIVMPVMDGVEAVSEILKESPNTYIVMCTAMGQKRMVIQAIMAGAKDFIVKPFSQNRLEEALIKCKRYLESI